MSYAYVPQYVTEEQELSESDCASDGQMMQHAASDVTELYRRKHQARNSPGTYYHTHIPGYYEPQSRPATTCVCNLQLDPRYCYYKATPQNQEGLFRSSTHITSNMRTCHDTKATSAATIKKYPVTARTPRYYRCPPAPLCKRPSTLCLPVTCQPDPAAFHRPRKASTEAHYRSQDGYTVNDYVMKTTVKRTDTRPVDSEGDVNSRLNDLENLLTKFDNEDDDEADDDPVEITGVHELSKILKPKIPPSIKAKQEKIVKLKATKATLNESTITTTQNVNKLEVKQAPDEHLDAFLQRLSKENTPKSDNKKDNNDIKELPKPKSVILGGKPKHTFPLEQKPPLDDNSALELHKSKSYIVSLIDKALSKELGTIPGDKCTRKEFLNMSPKKAIDLVNRHAAPKVFNRTTPNLDVAPSTSSKKDENYEIGKSVEEPLYLKQLKQLRWSHLRHIQREAKRLADLERFLDSFTEVDTPP